jgi:hypothetical protein
MAVIRCQMVVTPALKRVVVQNLCYRKKNERSSADRLQDTVFSHHTRGVTLVTAMRQSSVDNYGSRKAAEECSPGRKPWE